MKLSYRSRLRRSPRGGGMEKKALRAFFSIPPPLGERRRRER